MHGGACLQPSPWEAETGKLPKVQGQSALYSESVT